MDMHFAPWGGRRLLAALLASLSLALPAQAPALPLALDIVAPQRSGLADRSYSFSGVVRNDSGHAIRTGDLGLDFTGFDPAFVTLLPRLGELDVAIPEGGRSEALPLFDFILGSGALPGQGYSADVMLQHGSDELSEVSTVTVTVVPEPASVALLGLGLLALAAGRRRRPLG